MTEGATTVRTGVVGNLEEFDPKNDTMAAYIKRAAFYMDANNVPDKKVGCYLPERLREEYFSGPAEPGGTRQDFRRDYCNTTSRNR